ncbi:MAG: hypothetical protein AB8G15_12475 [Saprospiraceae bacterium]
MKTKYLLLLLLFLTSLFACQENTTNTSTTTALVRDTLSLTIATPQPVEKQGYFVSAPSGLNYRQSPQGKVLGKFEWNTLVTIVTRTGVYDTIANDNDLLKGEWVGVGKEDQTVYVFDGFLAKVKQQLKVANPKLSPQEDLAIYPLDSYENEDKETISVVMLTDGFAWNDHPDSLVIEDRYLGYNMSTEHHEMNPKYRKRFLERLKLKETDKVFIYNYSTTKKYTFAVKDLPLFAHLSIYGAGQPVEQYAYLIGFNLEDHLAIEDARTYYNAFVTIGKENPFVVGEMQAPTWEKVAPELFPASAQAFPAEGKYVIENTYQYEANGFAYFVQDFTFGINRSGRRLLVQAAKGKEKLLEKTYHSSEGTSLAPLNFVHPEDKEDRYQWTGKLFKNRAPVIFGFEYHSFGCPGIEFISPTERGTYIRCDNRH